MTLTLRPITGPDEIDLFNSFPYVLNDEIRDDLAEGRRRPEWLWLALRGDRVVARAGWWSRAGDKHPLLMDILDIDGDTDDGVRLVTAALPAGPTPPEYLRFVDPDWRDDPRVLAARDVPRIRASTDVGNTPMAAAFARAGYVVHGHQIDLTWR